MDCIFCKVIKKELPATFIYEDEDVVVFPDIHPIKPIHLLIVPKKHVKELLELDDQKLVHRMWEVAKKVVLEQGLRDKGYRVVINGGGAQVIDHLHIHIAGPMGKAAKM